MKTKVLILLAVAAILLGAGCIPISVQPIYLKSQVIQVDGLEGLWTMNGDEGWVRFVPDTVFYGYTVQMSEDSGEVSVFKGTPVKIGAVLMIDLFPEEAENPTMGEFAFDHLVPMHSFYRLDKVGPELKVTTMNFNWLSNYLSEHPDAIAHVWRDKVPIMTASTEEMQAFIAAHIDDADAWEEAAEYIKK